MSIAHKPLYLRLWHHCGNGVHNDYIYCAGTNKCLGNFKSLLAGVRLGNKEAVYINAEGFCINRVEGVLNIYKSSLAARFLRRKSRKTAKWIF